MDSAPAMSPRCQNKIIFYATRNDLDHDSWHLRYVEYFDRQYLDTFKVALKHLSLVPGVSCRLYDNRAVLEMDGPRDMVFSVFASEVLANDSAFMDLTVRDLFWFSMLGFERGFAKGAGAAE